MGSSYVPPIIGPQGLSVPGYNAVIAYYVAQFKSIYGQNVYLGNDSADFQLLSIIALSASDVMNLAVLLYNNQSPAKAIGAALDSLVKINGLARKLATASTATVTLTGVAGTVVNDGVVTDINGNRWNLPDTVTIGSLGTVSVLATCSVTGAIAATPGQINGIATPTSGWTSVTNAADANIGQPVETDSQLRARQAISTELPSITMLTGTIAAIAAVPGVTRYNVSENPTSGTDANGNPPHSITAVVEGGTDLDIATAIYNNKGIGCFTNGTDTVSITDPFTGNTQSISFDRPTYVPIYVTIPVHAFTGYTVATGVAIQVAVVAYLNSLQIGEIVTISGIIAAAMSVNPDLSMPLFSIRGLTAGTAPSPGAANDIPITFSQVSRGITGNVIITSV